LHAGVVCLLVSLDEPLFKPPPPPIQLSVWVDVRWTLNKNRKGGPSGGIHLNEKRKGGPSGGIHLNEKLACATRSVYCLQHA
jgi:hypothetical protein